MTDTERLITALALRETATDAEDWLKYDAMVQDLQHGNPALLEIDATHPLVQARIAAYTEAS